VSKNKNEVISCLSLQQINQGLGGLILKRHFADHAPITYDSIKERVMLVLKLYDKVDPKKVQNPPFSFSSSSFSSSSFSSCPFLIDKSNY